MKIPPWWKIPNMLPTIQSRPDFGYWLETDKKDINRARLFWEARNRGRTITEIAEVVSACGKKVGKSHVARLLDLADFIMWYEQISPSGENPEFALHEVKEGTFRKFWGN